MWWYGFPIIGCVVSSQLFSVFDELEVSKTALTIETRVSLNQAMGVN